MSVHTTTTAPPSPQPSPNIEKQKLKTFSPVILFHDHEYIKAGSGDLEHVHIPYDDHGGRHLDLHKKRIHEMLQTNGRYWLDIITWTRDHPEPLDHSPVPSLVSSPSPPYNSSGGSSGSSHHHHPLYNQQGGGGGGYYNDDNHHSSHGNYGNGRMMSSTSTRTQKRSLSTSSSTSSVIHATGEGNKKSSNNSSNNSNNKRRRGNLPKAVTAILRDWLSRHKKHPYPTEEEKASLAAETNLNLNQISNWFINARRRILQPMLEQEESEGVSGQGGVEEGEHLDRMAYHNEHHSQHQLDNDAYHNNNDHRRLRKRSATDVLTPTKYPPQKRMTHPHHHHLYANHSTTTTTSSLKR